MACQKMAAGGVVVSGQLADAVVSDGFGRGKKRGDEGWGEVRRECGQRKWNSLSCAHGFLLCPSVGRLWGIGWIRI